MFKHSAINTFVKIAIVSTSLAVAPVSASVIMISDDATLHQNYNERFFSQSGISGDEIVVLETAGDELPLSLALSRIIPESWKIEAKGDVDNTLVSWSGGMAWPHILRRIAHNEEVYVTLDWVQKIAAITAPERSFDSQVNKELVSEAAESATEFSARQAQRAQRRNETESQLARERRQIEELMRQQRESQEANQEYIARLNENNRHAEEERGKLQEALERERRLRQEMEERYAVIDPRGNVDVPDGADLFLQYQDRTVLPFNSSFEYFLKGGHADLITPDTPATFIAKPGSVREVVTAWADELGWAIEYTAGVNHYNPYEVEFQGTFYEVGAEFIRIFRTSNRPLNITFHPDVRANGKHGLVKVMDLNYRNR